VASLWAVTFLSAAALAFEVLLMRLFSIEQWHHFAYMIISIALLGYGASGTALSFLQERLRGRFPQAFTAFAALFGVSAPACFALSRQVPLNSLEIVWDGTQQLLLLLDFVVLAVPFFFAAMAIGLALARRRERIGIVYRSDLIGAGAGAMGIVLALYFFSPATCLKLIAGMGLFAAGLGARDLVFPRTVPTALFAAAVALPMLLPAQWVTPQPSPYKGLGLALDVPGGAIIAERSSPLGQLTVVESPTVPLRHAPGLSLNATVEPPLQLGVFTDGGAMTAITRFDGRPETISYLDFQPNALPYHLLERPRTLILGAGGGSEVLLARLHGARTIDAVEVNPQMVDLVRRDFADFAGNILSAEGVRVHVAEARSFVSASRERYDLVQVALLDSFSAASAGLYALDESTLYTVEALETYLRRLAPGGLLAITRWLKLPPRDNLKILATAREALDRLDVTNAKRRLALIRGWRTATVLVKNGPLTAADIAAIRTFCRDRSFDVAYYPGMPASEANRYNILDRAYLFDGAAALLGPERRRFLREYKFDVSPSTDDRPYFFHFLKWNGLRELVGMRGGSGLPLVEWGYLILLATLVQACVVSVVLVLLPLIALRRGRAGGRSRVFVFFLALGLAFLFIEIASIQRFVLFLGHPVHAVAVVLSGFLMFAGIGSGYVQRVGVVAHRAIPAAAAGIAAMIVFHLFGLPPLLEWLLPWPEPVKVAATLLFIAPLAFCMGVPFPLGLARIAGETPELVPWAWGINGCASVLSAVLATILAIHHGFSVVMVIALALYAVAAAVFSRPA
jgi:spermidine synthase